jgi:hypothetical protein
MVEVTVVGGDKMHGHPGILHMFLEIFRDGADVFHQTDGILENVFIDSLKNVFCAGIGGNLQGVIDMAVAKFLAGGHGAVQAKGGSYFVVMQRVHLICCFETEG